MNIADTSLQDVRREIDEIDDAIHDLVMRRAGLVDRVRRSKPSDGIFWRPSREAEIVRRLIGRHEGALPKSDLAMIWREIMSAMLRMQGPFSVAAYAPEGEQAFRDVARDHFGANTPLTMHRSAIGVVRAVADGAANVGVVPLPQEDEEESWWSSLIVHAGERPKIVARLPFAPIGDARMTGTEALVVANVDRGETGRDRSYIFLRIEDGVSRARLGGAFEKMRLKPLSMFRQNERDASGQTCFLLEVDGYVDAEDGRIAELLDNPEISAVDIRVIGGYAAPFAQRDLRSGR